MRCSYFIILYCLFLYSASAERGLAPLPAWNATDAKLLKEGKLKPGLALLTKEGVKQKDKEKPADPKDELPVREDVKIVPVPEKPEVNPLPLPDDRSKISRRLLEVCFHERPEKGLNDPQGLLSTQERADIDYGMKEHDEESPVPIYLFVFDELQMVPVDFEPETIFENHFQDDDEACVIVYYYLGAPERTQYYLGGGSSESVPMWQMRELLSNATHAAREKSDVFAQLDDFVGQLSMRLFWVEQIMGNVLPVAKEGNEKPLVKIGDESVVSGVVQNLILPKLLKLIGIGVGLVTLIGVYVWWRGRKRYGFAEPEVKQRLGAKRGAICGGILSYSNHKLPPSEQREQFKDPL